MALSRLIRARLLILALTFGTAVTPRPDGVRDVCGELARAAERRGGLPIGLVQAVALAESGRWLEAIGRSRAWPWTVTSVEETYYLASKDAAVDKVRELQARGRTNIDVGCMQVNLGYHGHAFRSLEQALDPAANVAYGAGFLKRLRAETRSWARAAAYYHSRDAARGEAYRTKVYRLWRKVRPQSPHVRETVRMAGSEDAGEPVQGPRVLRFRASDEPARAGSGDVPVLRGH